MEASKRKFCVILLPLLIYKCKETGREWGTSSNSHFKNKVGGGGVGHETARTGAVLAVPQYGISG